MKLLQKTPKKATQINYDRIDLLVINIHLNVTYRDTNYTVGKTIVY